MQAKPLVPDDCHLLRCSCCGTSCLIHVQRYACLLYKHWAVGRLLGIRSLARYIVIIAVVAHSSILPLFFLIPNFVLENAPCSSVLAGTWSQGPERFQFQRPSGAIRTHSNSRKGLQTFVDRLQSGFHLHLDILERSLSDSLSELYLILFAWANELPCHSLLGSTLEGSPPQLACMLRST